MWANLFAPDNVQLAGDVVKTILLENIWETFYMTVLSTIVAYVIGLPLGVLLVVGEKDGIRPIPSGAMHVVNVVVNLLRSVPFLILMIMALPLSEVLLGTMVGTKAVIPPLIIASFPYVARLVESSIREVDKGIIEAAQSMGATPSQIIWKVMIPESMPSLVSGFTIALTTILGYGAMAGIIGGGGLGMIAINYGYYRYKALVMLIAVVLLVVMVQIFQSVGTSLAIRCDKRIKLIKKRRKKG
jgi:D-methionine transport system permease protein